MSTTQLEKQKGFIAHAGIPIPGGFEIVEMWESQEAVDAWLKGIIKPASTEAGVVAPILQFYPAQRIVTR